GIAPRLAGAPDPVRRPAGLEERRRGVQPEREPRGAGGREPAKPCGVEGLRVLGVQRAVDRPLQARDVREVLEVPTRRKRGEKLWKGLAVLEEERPGRRRRTGVPG